MHYYGDRFIHVQLEGLPPDRTCRSHGGVVGFVESFGTEGTDLVGSNLDHISGKW